MSDIQAKIAELEAEMVRSMLSRHRRDKNPILLCTASRTTGRSFAVFVIAGSDSLERQSTPV